MGQHSLLGESHTSERESVSKTQGGQHLRMTAMADLWLTHTSHPYHTSVLIHRYKYTFIDKVDVLISFLVL